MGLRRTLGRLRDRWALPRVRAADRGPPRAEAILFSKDRPLQLHALLASYAELVRDPPPVHVLYRTSSDAYRDAYAEVLRASPAPLGRVVVERSFRDDLLALLDAVEAPRIFFLVDDIVFVRETDLAPLLRLDPARFVPSLRMGLHLRRASKAEQPLPPFRAGLLEAPDLRCWAWGEGTLDWAYPLSVDGHVFSTGEMRWMARHLRFVAPNSFEGALQRYLWAFRDRLGVCHDAARIVNIPCNRVQHECDNLHGDMDAAELLAVWQGGRRMDHRRLYGIENASAHEDVELAFVER